VHSFELWLRFVYYCARTIARVRSPFAIAPTEILGRELFSGHVNNAGNVLKPNAFLINHKSEFGISLDRMSLAPRHLFAALGEKAAARRNVRFKGFCTIEPDAISKVQHDGTSVLRVRGEPTCPNPCHANVPLPRDRDKDFYLLMATELLRYAKAPNQLQEH
jgi:hypothetical protein